MQLVIAEKPSVARDLARVLDVRPSGKTCFEGKGRVITWCVGHLVELEEPAAYDARWKSWRLDLLPMVPSEFKLRPVASTRDQLTAVCQLLRDQRFSEVVNACDAGREGELIFRYVYQLAGSRLPARRLWISSLTDEAIRQGFAALRPGSDLDALADAARCRSEADWLVGLNATRAVTVRYRTGEDSPLYSIGRVQTPTLAILVERERAVAAFVPQDFWQVKGELATADGARFSATWTLGKVSRLGSVELAQQLCERCREHGRAEDPLGPVVESLKQLKTREPPPMLFDLTSLQRTANKRFGLSAKATLDAAQALYEQHKLLTYPRTDSRHLPSDMVAELPKILGGVAGFEAYSGFARKVLENPPRLGKRFIDDSKIQDHHALIPTGKGARLGSLSRDELRVFDLVVRRFLGAFYPDAEFAQTDVVVRVGADGTASVVAGAGPTSGDETAAASQVLASLPEPPDRFTARGKVRLVAGWQEVAGFGGDDEDKPNGKRGKKDNEEEDATDLPSLTEGQRLAGAFAHQAKKTKPPSRHSEATLLSAMENAGKAIEDDELRAAMKDSGLGTPATRAATIETLLKRGFVQRSGKHLVPTPMGMALVESLPVPSLASPELTGGWEARLARMARGQEARSAFMADIVRYVREVIDAVRVATPIRAIPQAPTVPQSKPRRASRRTASAGASEGKASRPSRRSRSGKSEPPSPQKTVDGPSAPVPVGPSLADLACPRCKKGRIMAGKRGWGCSRWRDGCGFVVWFEENGVRRSEADLRAIVASST